MTEAEILAQMLTLMQEQQQNNETMQAILENTAYICNVIGFIAWLLGISFCTIIAYKLSHWLIIKPVKYWFNRALKNI